MVQLYLSGICPRSEPLISATRGLDRGRVTEEEVEAAREADVERLVRLQLEAGCDYVLDGLLNWQDLFRPFVEHWDGLEAGPLTRWFDNNTFFRQPVLVGPVEGAPLPEAYARTDLLPKGTPWKAVLPGPYTFRALAEDRHYGDEGKALEAIAAALAATAADLGQRGFALIQLQEPSLGGDSLEGVDWTALREAYQVLYDAAPTLALHVFFGPVSPHLDALADLPVGILGIDLYRERGEALTEATLRKAVALGCVDARNSLVEKPSDVAARAAELRDVLGPPEVILSPNADLEFLPLAVAEKKVRVLGEAKAKLAEAS